MGWQTTRRAARTAAASALLAATVGCVDRRFVVDTVPVQGVQVEVDGNPLGPSPVDAPYVYAGVYTFTASHPDYEPLVERVDLKAKWYQYPPFDLITEALYPGRIEDVRHVRLVMQPKRPVTAEELLRGGEALRGRAATLPPSSVPDRPDNAPPPVARTAPVVPPLTSPTTQGLGVIGPVLPNTGPQQVPLLGSGGGIGGPPQ